MTTEDFKFNTDTNQFEAEPSSSLLSDVVFILHTKCKIISHPGDWFMFPDKGNSCYEIQTMSKNVVDIIKNRLDIAFNQLRKDARCQSITIATRTNSLEPNRVCADIDVIEKNGSNFGYEFFTEVY